jgi:hypothetical protein
MPAPRHVWRGRRCGAGARVRSVYGVSRVPASPCGTARCGAHIDVLRFTLHIKFAFVFSLVVEISHDLCASALCREERIMRRARAPAGATYTHTRRATHGARGHSAGRARLTGTTHPRPNGKASEPRTHPARVDAPGMKETPKECAEHVWASFGTWGRLHVRGTSQSGCCTLSQIRIMPWPAMYRIGARTCRCFEGAHIPLPLRRSRLLPQCGLFRLCSCPR